MHGEPVGVGKRAHGCSLLLTGAVDGPRPPAGVSLPALRSATWKRRPAMLGTVHVSSTWPGQAERAAGTRLLRPGERAPGGQAVSGGGAESEPDRTRHQAVGRWA